MKKFAPVLLALGACDGILDLGSDDQKHTNVDANPTPSSPRRVFVTSTQYQGHALGGIAGADAKCASHASQAGLTGTYLAWLSTDQTSPAQRFAQSTIDPYVLVDGTLLANDWADLTDGSIANAIDITEHGTPLVAGTLAGSCRSVVGAWSATGPDGNLAPPMFGALTQTCNGWTGGTYGRIGTVAEPSTMGDVTPFWSDMPCMPDCASGASLYCFEQ